MGVMGNTNIILAKIFEEENLLGKPMNRLEDNIKMYLKINLVWTGLLWPRTGTNQWHGSH
jgi:hypothetical protein